MIAPPGKEPTRTLRTTLDGVRYMKRATMATRYFILLIFDMQTIAKTYFIYFIYILLYILKCVLNFLNLFSTIEDSLSMKNEKKFDPFGPHAGTPWTPLEAPQASKFIIYILKCVLNFFSTVEDSLCII